MTVTRKLSDAAQRAMWARMSAGAFTTRDLMAAAKDAGQSDNRLWTHVVAFRNDLKAKGAIYFTGSPQRGHWTLLPREQWNGSPIPSETPKPEMKAPVMVGPYDPAPEIEGPNNGLTEALAEHLWHDLGGGDESYTLKSLPIMEQRAWRECADRAIKMLLGLGMVGPAGVPREKYTGWSYKWLYEAATWEICDEEGGYVAMVANDSDAPLFLAAPDMQAAIEAVLERAGTAGGIKRSDLRDLADALPLGSRWKTPAEPDTPPTPPSASGA